MSKPGEDSLGQQHLKLPFSMKVPHFDFVYRLSCEMAETTYPIGAPFDGTQMRMILPIKGGMVKGPHIDAEIVQMSGADWGSVTKGADFMRLDARYTLKTTDGVFIYIRSKGVFSGGPGGLPPALDLSGPPPAEFKQDQVEWFSRLQFEAPPGPYNWMNGAFVIGVLAMSDRRITIDAYRITNFPNVAPRDMHAAL